MSYERQLKLNQMARELTVAGRHVAHAVGAGNRAIETASHISPAFAEQTRVFVNDNLGLQRDVWAIGSYIGQVMWPQYESEMNDAIEFGYKDAAGAPVGRRNPWPPRVVNECPLRRG